MNMNMNMNICLELSPEDYTACGIWLRYDNVGGLGEHHIAQWVQTLW